jgi:hypothetical protein
MKTKLCAAIIAVAASMSPALAQNVIAISPDETVLVERYVREIPEPPPVIEEHMTLRPGSIIPEGVPLRPFENVEGLKRLAFFVSVDHKIVVADPRTRMVVHILDQKG